MRLDHIRLRYHRRGPWVLDEVDATLSAGEVAVVTGRNGTGKSTLLQVAAGVLRPTHGRVLDRPRRVGWVPERFPADQPFTVRRYLTAMARVRGDREPAVDAWAERLFLRPYLDVGLSALSKGTAQKVGLIQALLTSPDLLILDEPWEGLDAQTRTEVPAIIAEVAAAGGIVLVSDHIGATARLPGALWWRLVDGVLHVERPSAGAEYVVSVAVAGELVSTAVAQLSAAGHRVLDVRVRQEQ